MSSSPFHELPAPHLYLVPSPKEKEQEVLTGHPAIVAATKALLAEHNLEYPRVAVVESAVSNLVCLRDTENNSVHVHVVSSFIRGKLLQAARMAGIDISENAPLLPMGSRVFYYPNKNRGGCTFLVKPVE